MGGVKERRLNFTVPFPARKVAGVFSNDQPDQWDRELNCARDLFDDVTYSGNAQAAARAT
jgi:hypothetical protein